MTHENIIETLKILKSVTFDGNLPSKSVRDWLVDNGLVVRGSGYNWLSESGVKLCKVLLLLGDE